MGVLTTVGLISALFSDGGAGDMLAWVTLGIPLAVCVVRLASNLPLKGVGTVARS
jgi:hypothetical protein